MAQDDASMEGPMLPANSAVSTSTSGKRTAVPYTPGGADDPLRPRTSRGFALPSANDHIDKIYPVGK